MTEKCKVMKKRITAISFLLLLSIPVLMAQAITVKGKVLDTNREPLIGVVITIKDSPKGTASDIDGNFELRDVSAEGTLVFSYMGYQTQEIKANGSTFLNIVMQEAALALEQVVVVGYGSQKKVNLTGAVAAVSVDESLTSRSIANVSSALQGLIPGLQVSQTSGMAGNNAAELFIRGIGTINNSAPLIVVDDIPDVDMNRININDIENISVLKDASASAVYGSRAANGVILITTKSGKSGKTQITVSANYAWEKPTESYDFISNYPRALLLHRQSKSASDNSEANQTFQKGTIDQWLALGMIDEKRYPNTDWWDIIMRTGSLQNYNVAASGGNEKSNFYMSAAYMKQEGLQINNSYDRYNIRFNYDYKISKTVTTGIRMDGSASNFKYAMDDGFTGQSYDMQNAIAGIYPYDSEIGEYGGVMAYGEDPMAFNPLEYFNNRLKKKDRQEANGTAYISWEPIKGLIARVDYGGKYYNEFLKEADKPGRAWNFQTNDYGSRVYVDTNAGVSNTTNTGYKTLLNARLNYNTIINRAHNIGAMFVYSEEYWRDRYQRGWGEESLHPSLSEIDGTLKTTQTAGGSTSTEGLRSYIGRLNYSAFDKYLFEFNFRVDGSSRYFKGHQYGFFPSGSFGWRFSEESFVKPVIDKWLSSGKLRLSYGALGNNQFDGRNGRTIQQEILYPNHYVYNGTEIAKGFVYSKMLNQSLSWESTYVFNLGLDLVMLNGRLSTEFDYYDRLTKDMIQQSQLSILLSGAYEKPYANIGNLRNRGIEANITWRDNIEDFKYSANFNISYNKSNLEKWSEYLGRGSNYSNNNTFIDMPYGYVYPLVDKGIAQTWQDIYDSAVQNASVGDILYEDINGDGRIDDKDRVAYANSKHNSPMTNFALNLQAEWKGIDISMLFQGAAGRKEYWKNNYNVTTLPNSRYAANVLHWTEPWSWENRNGSWSRLGGSANNRDNSTFWLDDLKYLRMKNLMIGYTLPKTFTRKFWVDSFRIYGSAENLFTITDYRGLDPEKTGNNNDMYPITKSFSIGVNVSF